MMNFMLSTHMLILKNIELQERIAKRLGPELAIPNHQERKELESALRSYTEGATELEMPGVLARIRRIEALLKTNPPWEAVGDQLKILHEAFEDDTDESFIYVYPRSKAKLLEGFRKEWEAALNAFPSIETEAERGIDCFALGHDTACVFHMCRVAEVGLRVLARERGVLTGKRGAPIEWATWGQVFEKIDPYVEDIRRKPNGPKKDEALVFYDTAVSDLRAIHSLYRDQTMHLRDTYDPGEAQSAMFRARELMTKLATKLKENSTSPIDWGF